MMDNRLISMGKQILEELCPFKRVVDLGAETRENVSKATIASRTDAL